jgi:hypothetical protein
MGVFRQARGHSFARVRRGVKESGRGLGHPGLLLDAKLPRYPVQLRGHCERREVRPGC